MIILGFGKVLCSILATTNVIQLLPILDQYVPVSILSVLLLLAGHELAMTGIKEIFKEHYEHQQRYRQMLDISERLLNTRDEENDQHVHMNNNENNNDNTTKCTEGNRYVEDHDTNKNGRNSRGNNNNEHGDSTLAVGLITGLVIVGTGQTHVGAICGWITYIIYGNKR